MSEPANVEAIPPRYWWLKRMLVGVLVILVAVGVLRGLVGREAERRLHARVVELRAAGEPLLPEDFVFEDVPDDENAALLLMRAAAAFVEPENKDVGPEDILADAALFESRAEDVQALLDANREALRLLRAARFKPRVDWGYRFTSPMMSGEAWREYWRLQPVARVAGVAALQHLHRGDQVESFESVSDVLSMADRVTQGHPHLLATMLGTMSYADVYPALGELAKSPVTARAAARRVVRELLDEEQLAEGMTRAIRVERAVMLDVTPGMGGGDLMMTPGEGLRFTRRALMSMNLYLLKPVLQLDGIRILDHYSVYVEATHTSDLRAVDEVLAQVREPQFRFSVLEKRRRFLSMLLMPSFFDVIRRAILDRARRRLGASALAIRLYVDDYGRLPQTLDELVPEYLPFVPLDPTSAEGEPIVYVPGGPNPHVAFRDRGKRGKYVFSLIGCSSRSENAPAASRPASSQSKDQGDGVEDEPRDSREDQPSDEQP